MNRKAYIQKYGIDKFDAKRWVERYTAIGKSRAVGKEDRKITSISTANQYIELMKKMSAELRHHDKTTLDRCTPEQFTKALERFSTEVSQKRLNNMRRAGELGFRTYKKYADVTIDIVKSEVSTIQKSRAYTNDAIQYIHDNGLSEKHKLSFELSVVAGLRAHELLTLRRADEQPPSDRNYTERYPDRPSSWVAYTVRGKGGLVTLKMFPPNLSKRLEAVRIEKRSITDRTIRYNQVYDLVGGKAISAAFTRASKKTLGFSHGIHGCRHTYAQRRMSDLNRFGYDRKQALLTVSQEMGHLRPDITEVYLR